MTGTSSHEVRAGDYVKVSNNSCWFKILFMNVEDKIIYITLETVTGDHTKRYVCTKGDIREHVKGSSKTPAS